MPGPNAHDRILLAAHELFYRDGIRATGIDRVIAASGVTKVTFYRHFPSKTDLIREFLEYRHQRWMAWFADALSRHGGEPGALPAALAEWFSDGTFRGCAFINSVGELGGVLPDVLDITRRHKRDMADVIAGLLPPDGLREDHAKALALAVDGAIIQAQYGESPSEVIESLQTIIRSVLNL